MTPFSLCLTVIVPRPIILTRKKSDVKVVYFFHFLIENALKKYQNMQPYDAEQVSYVRYSYTSRPEF